MATEQKLPGRNIDVSVRLGALLPCPFCGAPAETDHNRHFYDYRGYPSTAVAIYCTGNAPHCVCDMTLCRGDMPELDSSQMMSLLIEMWNRRAPNSAVDAPRTHPQED